MITHKEHEKPPPMYCKVSHKFVHFVLAKVSPSALELPCAQSKITKKRRKLRGEGTIPWIKAL